MSSILFQSTLSARRATNTTKIKCSFHFYFNPRSPRGERPYSRKNIHTNDNFNPRSPRGERLYIIYMIAVITIFQSTLSARRATFAYDWLVTLKDKISIHALREESDVSDMITSSDAYNFNPRSPRGERRGFAVNDVQHVYFNPRSPRGERLRQKQHKIYLSKISIHALREESDSTCVSSFPIIANFNPRSPRGERLTAII